MAGPKLQFLPEQHTDFVFSVEVGWTTILVLCLAAAVAVLAVLRARRRRAGQPPRER